VPTRGQLLPSAWSAATSSTSTGHHGLLVFIMLLEQQRPAGNNLCNRHLCGWFVMYSWMEVYVFNLIVSDNSVTFFLAENCIGFELQDI